MAINSTGRGKESEDREQYGEDRGKGGHETLYLKRIRVPKGAPMGLIIQFLQEVNIYDVDAEVERFLMARFLTPALRRFRPDLDVEWHARECIAQLESWSNVLRECYGLSGFSKLDPMHDQNSAIVSAPANDVDVRNNDAQPETDEQEARQLDEKMSLARSFLEF